MYADDTHVYITFKLKTPHEAVDTINECISDLQTWMINHKLKIQIQKLSSSLSAHSFPKLPKLPARQPITYNIPILTFKAYHKTAPQYICDLINPRKI